MTKCHKGKETLQIYDTTQPADKRQIVNFANEQKGQRKKAKQ